MPTSEFVQQDLYCMSSDRLCRVAKSIYDGSYQWLIVDAVTGDRVGLVAGNSRRSVTAPNATAAATLLAVERPKYKRDKEGALELDARGKPIRAI